MLKKLRRPFYLPNHKDIACAFKSDGQWQRFCFDKKNPVFEFLNKKFIDALYYYLLQQSESLKTDNLPIIILELGAGNGRLSYFLQQKIEIKNIEGIKFIATDSGKWKIKNIFPVEIIEYAKALKKYNPKIVLSSWMPYKIDFTKTIRATKNVKEYILIGEIDDGCCGDEWKTWGHSWSQKNKTKIIPYKADGFVRLDLNNISKYQICRTDQHKKYRHSHTTSFRRFSVPACRPADVDNF